MKEEIRGEESQLGGDPMISCDLDCLILFSQATASSLRDIQDQMRDQERRNLYKGNLGDTMTSDELILNMASHSGVHGRHGYHNAIDEFLMLWLPWATRRKEWLKMAIWTATQHGWSSKHPLCAILFYASPRVTKACETCLY